MAQQEEGWPLGLQPLNVRVVGLAARNNGDYSGSVSFNTLVTGSPISSTDSSSDLDTESTGSFFYDRSITLGSLIGVSSIFELSKRSLRRRKIQPSASAKESKPKNKSSRSWLLFSFCSSENSIATNENYKRNKNYPSLGHFLAVERKAANDQAGGGRNQLMSPNNVFVADYEFSVTQPNTEIERNTLFVNGCIAPPRSSSCSGSDMESRNKDGMGNDGRFGVPEFFSCMCGKPSH